MKSELSNPLFTREEQRAKSGEYRQSPKDQQFHVSMPCRAHRCYRKTGGLGRFLPGFNDDRGESPLHVAAAGGHIDAIAALVRGEAYINGKDEEGSTALHFAVEGGHVGAIEQLVDLGADPNLGLLGCL